MDSEWMVEWASCRCIFDEQWSLRTECRNEGLILRGKYGFHEIAGRQCRSRLRGSAADAFAKLLSAELIGKVHYRMMKNGDNGCWRAMKR